MQRAIIHVHVPRITCIMLFLSALCLYCSCPAVNAAVLYSGKDPLPEADGYCGIWFGYRPIYGGGMGTFPHQHIPLVYYSPKAKKTFFVFGGTDKDNSTLFNMVSYYDHTTGTVPRPRVLIDKQTTDGLDGSTIMLDDDGYIWIFSAAHGTRTAPESPWWTPTSRPSYIHRSREPYSIRAFDLVKVTNFSYPQPWYLPGKGFCFLHTRYFPGYEHFLFVWFSPDGVNWKPREPRKPLGQVGMGHYQISWRNGGDVGTAFNYAPSKGGFNARTNLYYMQTPDMGRTWVTVDGRSLKLPLTDTKNPALVHEYESEGRLVFLKDMQFDNDGHPVILYLTSGGPEPTPENGPRIWHTARWTGKTWTINRVTESDHNYDTGSLHIEDDGTWRVIAPTEPGPQPGCTGGEVAMWTSPDQGQSWTKVKQLTRNSLRNHSYVRRPVNAHPDFYAFWADGDGRKKSQSRLYFTNRAGDHVWQLPVKMQDSLAKPEIVW